MVARSDFGDFLFSVPRPQGVGEIFRKGNPRFYQKCFCCPLVPEGEDFVETSDIPFVDTVPTPALDRVETGYRKVRFTRTGFTGEPNVKGSAVGPHGNLKV